MYFIDQETNSRWPTRRNLGLIIKMEIILLSLMFMRLGNRMIFQPHGALITMFRIDHLRELLIQKSSSARFLIVSIFQSRVVAESQGSWVMIQSVRLLLLAFSTMLVVRILPKGSGLLPTTNKSTSTHLQQCLTGTQSG